MSTKWRDIFTKFSGGRPPDPPSIGSNLPHAVKTPDTCKTNECDSWCAYSVSFRVFHVFSINPRLYYNCSVLPKTHTDVFPVWLRNTLRHTTVFFLLQLCVFACASFETVCFYCAQNLNFHESHPKNGAPPTTIKMPRQPWLLISGVRDTSLGVRSLRLWSKLPHGYPNLSSITFIWFICPLHDNDQNTTTISVARYLVS